MQDVFDLGDQKTKNMLDTRDTTHTHEKPDNFLTGLKCKANLNVSQRRRQDGLRSTS